MRVSIVYAIMLLSVSVGFAPRVFAHSSEQTNALICAMLRRSLIRPNIDAQTGVLKSYPTFVTSQQEFFASDDEWSEDERRAVFDWYLENLSTTSHTRGVIAGRMLVDNPIACAAIAQCEAMAYTNALPVLVENISKGADQSRMATMRVVFKWSPLNSLVELVGGIVTNEVEYSMYERNLTYCQFCARLKEFATGQNGDVDPIVDDAVRLMYSRRNDPAGAVAIDKTLVALRPGYSNSVDRYSCAISLLTDERIPVECKYYFGNVTNDIGSVLQ